MFARECLLGGIFARWHVCSGRFARECLPGGIFAREGLLGNVCSLDTKNIFHFFFKKIQFLKFNLESKKSKKNFFGIFFWKFQQKN